jgi:hypothetical protein
MGSDNIMPYCALAKLVEYEAELTRLHIRTVERRELGARTLVVITYGDSGEGLATADVTGANVDQVDVHIAALREAIA